MNVTVILIIWGIWDFLFCCHVCSLTAEYGKEIAKNALNLGVSMFNIMFQIVIVAICWKYSEWWYPVVIHFAISGMCRFIYRV